MKNIILFVNAVRPATFAALRSYQEQTGRKLLPMVIVDKKIQDSITERNGQNKLRSKVPVISADFDNPTSLRRALQPYMDRILAVTSQYENCIVELQKLVPYFPYLPMPTEKSLEWATEKKSMRQHLEAYDSSLVPGYLEVHDASDASLHEVEKTLQYPLVVKPSGLEGSLLVSMVHNQQELRDTLEHTFHEIQASYNTWIKRQKPAVLVEEFMHGEMYSVDTYVGHDGTCHHTPPVRVITGKQVGFDDFFGYVRIAPAGLGAEESQAAQETAEKACHALQLRSVTAHVELMRTPTGWKVIELGPRIGGYRHDIYSLSYGINHIINDARNRAGEIPDISHEVTGHTAVYNIYAPHEGILQSIAGLETVQALPSFISARQLLYPGDLALFAKNSGDPVFEITLSNAEPAQFQQDMQVVDNAFVIQTSDPALVTV